MSSRPAAQVLSTTPCVKALARWATGKRISDRLPKLRRITCTSFFPEAAHYGAVLKPTAIGVLYLFLAKDRGDVPLFGKYRGNVPLLGQI